MPIKVQCSACSNKLTVPDSYAGKRGKCPKCSEQINIPAKSSKGEKAKKAKPKGASSDDFPSFSGDAASAGLSAPNISAPATAAPDLSAPSDSGGDNPFAVTAPRKKVKKSSKTISSPREPLVLSSSKLRQLGVLSTATTLGIVYAMVGLVFGLVGAALMMLVSLIGLSVAPPNGGGGQLFATGIGSALVVIIFYPIMLGIFGFIGGAILAFVYNLAAKITGGIEFRFGA